MIDTVQRLHSGQNMALRTRTEWLRKNPGSTLSGTSMQNQCDDSLTSLNWLHNLNIFTTNTPTPVCGHASSPDNNTTEVLQMLVTAGVAGVTGDQSATHASSSAAAASSSSAAAADEQIDYRSNPFVKPPYSYATLICMAMKQTHRNKITLSGIYSWITENFLYYRNADPSWQVRHNTTLQLHYPLTTLPTNYITH